MAVIDAFRRPEVNEILKRLKNGPMTAAELNNAIVTQQGLNISTATLYRRLKELLMANVLVKEGTAYQLTEFGNQLYLEFIKTREEEKFVPPKEQTILHSLSTSMSSKKDLLSNLSGSNSELLEKIDHLENEGYIKKIPPKKQKRSRGRPASKYKITEKGRETIKDIQDLKQLARQEVVHNFSKNSKSNNKNTASKSDKEERK